MPYRFSFLKIGPYVERSRDQQRDVDARVLAVRSKAEPTNSDERRAIR
jgi:hypothetical protein